MISRSTWKQPWVYRLAGVFLALIVGPSSGLILFPPLSPAAVGQSIDDPVGASPDGTMVTPVNQRVTPFGRTIPMPALRPQVIAISPNGKWVYVSGKTSELLVLDAASGRVVQRVRLLQGGTIDIPVVTNQIQPDTAGQVSYTGLIVSKDGSRIYLSNVDGWINPFSVDADGKLRSLPVIALPDAHAPQREEEIPSGLALSEDQSRLYVCGSLSNRVLEIELATGQCVRQIDVGAVPYDLVVRGHQAVVTHWAGRRAGPGDLTGPAGRGTVARVDPVRYIASEGSVGLVDLDAGKMIRETITGLHASGVDVSPDGKWIAVANAGSDTVSILPWDIDATPKQHWTKSTPADLFGASPNAVRFSPDGKYLWVANGSQNAIAVMRWDGDEPEDTKLMGLIPVGWYPGAIAYDPTTDRLLVANIKGHQLAPRFVPDSQADGFNSRVHRGTLTFIPLEEGLAKLPELSQRVAENLRAEQIRDAFLPPRDGQPPRAVPERIGEPSTIRHVVYIIKENRTYDQLFGDIKEGNGDAKLCTFGESITPNQHALARQFVLLDNTYCAGILSADGHQWSTTAISTDYLEKSFAGFPRSYPDGMAEEDQDVIAYSPAGFIWDNAIASQKTLRNYGEFMSTKLAWADPARTDPITFMDGYRFWRDGLSTLRVVSEPSIESLRPYCRLDTVGWDIFIPDQYRADRVLEDLKACEADGTFPNLTIVCLPGDHTMGTKEGFPTPQACMADNDLAVGRIVDGLSHSKFWPQMAIFVIEDDPQNGWDHVSGYRTIAQCISPYTKRGAVVSTQYNTTSILRTIEQILGMKPMNQFDASATPMFDCFQDAADLTPFNAIPSSIPLDQLNPSPSAINDSRLRQDAIDSAAINLVEMDRAPEGVLNAILWRAQRGTTDPFPQWAIQVVEDEDEEEDADD
jgi:DNA-binding beta-propeller fold protein YncE